MRQLNMGRVHIRCGRFTCTGVPLWLGWFQIEVGEINFYAEVNR